MLQPQQTRLCAVPFGLGINVSKRYEDVKKDSEQTHQVWLIAIVRLSANWSYS
jgi:hypothetical protein